VADRTRNGGADRSRERAVELREWLASLDYVIERGDAERVSALLRALRGRAHTAGIALPWEAETPYCNTIPASQEPPFPGDPALEWELRSLVRWNAMAMVVRANRGDRSLGGHLSTYASAATLFEVGFNHFFRGRTEGRSGDQVFFQGHAAPGVYARAFLEGRLSVGQLEGFRSEVSVDGGLPSYPHPWLLPDFWEFPSVSMGLAPIMAIYQARFNRYLEDRGLAHDTGRVWALIGDGECDEPESLGALSLASREGLDNLVFVVNCNLQRLDGPVRGNGKVIQELERVFRGAGWNVIKVVWGGNWDPLLERDREGLLLARMEEAVDGDYQKYSVESGAYVREHFFGTDPRLSALVEDLSDEELRKLRRGGHDPEKVHAAYDAALAVRGAPTVILAKTLKGYGLGEAGEGRNVSHKQKQLNEDELRRFRDRFAIPISDDDVEAAPFHRPDPDAPVMQYLRQRREALGGFLPRREARAAALDGVPASPFEEFLDGSGERPVATTMAMVRLLSKLLSDEELGHLLVPIVPDEARTFGMDALFRQVGIYSHEGQRYEPVDRENLLYYRESERGQLLEEGITEAGSASSFAAAGTAYATHGIPIVPFFFFYSMFGFQRVGDLLWAAGDMRARGFLIGATAGRTTLTGEGLQHQDGHSHVLALAHPCVRSWDPAYAYEVAVIVEHGLQRLLVDQADEIHYLTVENEPYPMPALPEGARDGIVRGMHRIAGAGDAGERPSVAILASGALVNEALAARRLLAEEYEVVAEVWSVTSWGELLRDAEAHERSSRLQPEAGDEEPYVRQQLDGVRAVVGVSDYLKLLPESLASWVPAPLVALGTNGFGRSDDREALRDFFEVDRRHIALAALQALSRAGERKQGDVAAAVAQLGIDPERVDPARA